jgi:hypothetical protein
MTVVLYPNMPAITTKNAPEELLVADLRAYAHQLIVVQNLGIKFHETIKEYQRAQKLAPDSENATSKFKITKKYLHALMFELLPEGELCE